MKVVNTNIETFARQNHVKTRTDGEESIIPGRSGYIYEYDVARLGLLYRSDKTGWNARRDACVEAGMTILQNGDMEGTLSFDPANSKQAELALKVAAYRFRSAPMSPASGTSDPVKPVRAASEGHRPKFAPREHNGQRQPEINGRRLRLPEQQGRAVRWIREKD
jgi:hypothetical protein